MAEHDDLAEWADDPLVQALRAPGSESELTDQARLVAAYRQAHPRHSTLRRAVGRLGVGGTAVVASVALTSGVAAAAYSQTLPDPVQEIAHDVLGPIGVPPVPKKPPVEAKPVVPQPTQPRPTATPTTSLSPTSSPEASPEPTPAEPSPTETVEPTATTPTPTETPSATPTESPSAEPSLEPSPTTAPVVRPRALSASVSATKVDVGATVQVDGVLTGRNRAPVVDRTVWLAVRQPGERDWSRIDSAVSGSDGSVTLTTAALGQNVRLRLAVNWRVRSDGVSIVVVPTVSATVGEGSIDVTTVGGRAGDTVVLLRKVGKRLVEAGRQPLDATGATRFVVEAPAVRPARYVIRLKSTRLHAGAATRVTVPAAE